MNEIYFTEYELFNKVMILINYLDDSATILLKLLHNAQPINDYQLSQIKYYNEVLLCIQHHSHQLKDEWIDMAKEPQKFMMNMAEFYSDYENIKSEMKKLQELVNNILDTEFYVDPEGVLIHLIKER